MTQVGPGLVQAWTWFTCSSVLVERAPSGEKNWDVSAEPRPLLSEPPPALYILKTTGFMYLCVLYYVFMRGIDVQPSLCGKTSVAVAAWFPPTPHATSPPLELLTSSN